MLECIKCSSIIVYIFAFPLKLLEKGGMFFLLFCPTLHSFLYLRADYAVVCRCHIAPSLGR